MGKKLIRSYQPSWNSEEGRGYFWFTYFDGERELSSYVNGESFAIVLDILRNEGPVYGDHTNVAVTTMDEPIGEEEQP